jgi:hypothetical protein
MAAVLAGMLATTTGTCADESFRLSEPISPGYRYHVSVRVDLAGTLVPPAEKGKPVTPLAISGDSAIEYDERVLALDKTGNVRKTLRLCRRTDFRRTLAGQPQQSSLRPAVQRLVIYRRDHAEVPFSPDGPLTWGEIDLIRTDVFTPALAGLLPTMAVRAGDSWNATEGAIRELTDLERIDEGKVECRLQQVIVEDGKKQVRVALSGTVRGLNEDGPNRQVLEGYFQFDLQSNYLSYLFLKGTHILLDKDGREVGRVGGRFVMTRQVNIDCPELSDEGMRGVVLDPNDDNTLLLYDNPDLGIRFVYPRRWRVSSVRGSQITLDGSDGNGLLLTIDSAARTTNAAQFLTECRDWLTKQRARIVREEPLRSASDRPALDHFAFEAEMSGQPVLMDYYVSHQSAGGITVAARLVPADREAARRELEKLAKSVMLAAPAQGKR